MTEPEICPRIHKTDYQTCILPFVPYIAAELTAWQLVLKASEAFAPFLYVQITHPSSSNPTTIPISHFLEWLLILFFSRSL